MPGISFTLHGRVWFRRDRAAAQPRVTAEAARAAALLEVDSVARRITSDLAPDESHRATQKTALALADWRPTSAQPGVACRAAVEVTLAAEDAARAAEFERARRTARLTEATTVDRIDFLRKTLLSDPGTARIWWLDRNLSGAAPDTSWATFDHVVQPLILHAEQDDVAHRISSLLVAAITRMHDEPGKLATLAQALPLFFGAMNWPDLATQATQGTQGSTAFEVSPAVPPTSG